MRRPTLALIMTGITMTMTACSDKATTTTDPPAADVVLRIVVDDEVAADWTLDSLEATVSYTELSADGDKQSGPLLLDVLVASGVVEWDSGRVFGMGEGRVFEVTLDITAADVDDEWILDVTNKGSLKLASPQVPRQQWVRDVGEIRIP
jgi:hypothetical protein